MTHQLALEADIEVLWVHLQHVDASVAGTAQQDLVCAGKHDVLDLPMTQSQLAYLTAFPEVVQEDAMTIVILRLSQRCVPAAMVFLGGEVVQLTAVAQIDGVLL